MHRSIWIGYDPREDLACHVAKLTAERFAPIEAEFLRLSNMRNRGLYRRPTERRDGRLWDTISDAPMATEHAVARFLVPHIAGGGLALFMDGDVLVRSDITQLFARAAAKPNIALWCVHHDHAPEAGEKMDGQIQTAYARKNWSSVMLWNLDHPAHAALTLGKVNSLPGRDLHRFCWLDDHLIGALPSRFNHLVGAQPHDPDAAIAHFTLGTPDMPGYAEQPFADEWRAIAETVE